MSLSLTEKVRGCLYGASIGAELGFRKTSGWGWGEPSWGYDVIIEKALEMKIDWPEAPQQRENSTWDASLVDLLSSVAQCYIQKNGRITPEEWGAELQHNSALAQNMAFWLMGVHSTQELLKEGMNPRLSGLGAIPSGHMCTAVIPVGIYHAGDPETAYLDAVEIASVSQRSPGVEWAALTAAAIAEALKPGATADTVIATTLEIARKRAARVHDDILKLINGARETTREQFPLYFANTMKAEEHVWRGQNPIAWAFMLLPHFSHESERLITMAMLGWDRSIRVQIAGALAGALNGLQGLPQKWIDGAAPLVTPMLALEDVVTAKLEFESIVITEIEAVAAPADAEDVPLFERIYGCILAGAIGNAMGSPVENSSYLEIEEKYPGGITGILEPSRLEDEDDNQMAMLLTETYLKQQGSPVSARDFGETWKEKFKRSKFFYCMQNSYDLIRGGMDARIAGHWSWVTGSTVMCMEPVGIYHLCDPANAAIDAVSISYMYQRGLDVTAASILAASVAEALRPEATVDSILQSALKAAPRSKMLTFDTQPLDTPYDFISKCLDVAGKYDDVFAARKELYEKCLRYHSIDPLELLGLSYAMFKIANGDVRLSAIGGTNIGRDSDTIAGRGAMLSGALRGASNVPQEWISVFKEASLEKIKRNARTFTDFILQKKLPYMKDRQRMLEHGSVHV